MEMIRCRHDPKMQDVELETEKAAVKGGVSIENVESRRQEGEGKVIYLLIICLFLMLTKVVLPSSTLSLRRFGRYL